MVISSVPLVALVPVQAPDAEQLVVLEERIYAEDYMKANSISIVLPKNQIFMGNVEMDITNDIIELVNKIVK